MLLTENKDGCYSSPPNVWIRLSGPAAGLLEGAFYGTKVEVFQENRGAAQSLETSKSAQIEEECITSRGAPPGGSGDAEYVSETGGGAIEIVNAETVPPTKIVMGGSTGPRKFLKVLKTNRIVLLGETNVGKSSLGNAILGEDVFEISQTQNDGKRECQAESKSVHGRRITVIDTPGFCDSDKSESALKLEVARSISSSNPGPHVFLIVLKVEKFPKQQRDVIDQIRQCFSEEALKYAAVVFTHGDQLPEGKKIEEYVAQSKWLSDLVKKCSGRCHIIDNNNNRKSNRFQVAELLNTVDEIIKKNRGGFYINGMLQAEKSEEKEEGNTRSVGNVPQGGAGNNTDGGAWVKLTGPAAGSLTEALFGRAGEVEEPDDGCKEDEREDVSEKEEETVIVTEDEKEGSTEAENEDNEEENEEPEKENEENEETDKETKKLPQTPGGRGCDKRKAVGGGGSGNVLSSLFSVFSLAFGLGGAVLAGAAAVLLGSGPAAAVAAAAAVGAVVTAAAGALATAVTTIAGTVAKALKIVAGAAAKALKIVSVAIITGVIIAAIVKIYKTVKRWVKIILPVFVLLLLLFFWCRIITS